MANFVEKVCSIAFREVKDTFTVIWKIEYKPENKIRYIASDTVSFYFQPQTVWFLSLFINGNDMALYLNRNDNRPDVVVIDFELSLLTLGDLPQCVRVCRNHKFSKKDQYCFDNFLRLDDGNVKCFPLWFPNNSLTVRCRIWQGENAIQPTYCFLSSVFVKDRFSTDWSLEDYRTENIECNLGISTGILGRIPCSIGLIIDTKTRCPTHVRMMLSINVQRCARLVCTISIQTSSEGLVHRKTEDCPFNVWCNNHFIWNFPYHIDKDDPRLQRFLLNDDLHLRLEFEFWLSLSDGSDVSVFDPSNNNLRFPISTGESSPSDDCLINPVSQFQDSTHRRRDSTVADSSLRQEDSTVGDSSLRQEDSTVGDSSLRQEDSTVGNSAPLNLCISSRKDSAVGGSASCHKDSTVSGSFSGHKDSTVGGSASGHKDSAVGGSSSGHKDSAVGGSASGHKNSSVGGSASGHKDSAVGGSASGHKDSVIEDSALGHKNSAASDSTLVNQDTATGDSTLSQRDTVRPLRILRKRKLP